MSILNNNENSFIGEINQESKYMINTDLGLFNKLLEMIDGDWVDSIHGICDHILERFKALGVILSVFDRKFNEFIYIVHSFTRDTEIKLFKNVIGSGKDTLMDIIQKVYSINRRIVVNGPVEQDEIYRIAEKLFDDDKKKAEEVINDFNLKTVLAYQLIESRKNFKVFIHVLSDKPLSSSPDGEIEKYLTQLNVALEIVFLVRDLYIKATHDGLTKLFNHKQGQILLQREMERIKRNRQPLTIAMFDVDNFKLVNDKFGHQSGDAVLQTLGEIFTASLRKCDIISRYGGEEFLLILPDAELKNAVDVFTRLKEKIQNHKFQFSGKEYNITASFGVVQYDTDMHIDYYALISDADRKLYKAKVEGKNKIIF